MDRLWSPWRSQYIQSIGNENAPGECVFCAAIASASDDERYLVRRHRHCVTLLNLYPYNSGHLLIVPLQHTDSYLRLDAGSHMEMWDLVRVWQHVLSEVMRPQGFNIGSNVGRVAGAGIDQHIHLHLVPRWSGDMNFMPVISDTKVISESMHDTMLRLREGYDSFSPPAAGA